MTTFKEINLQVGARLQMTLQRATSKKVYYPELIGYLDGEYLIIKTPVENEVSVRILLNEQLTLRILSGVGIFTFTCSVIAIFCAPYHYIHLSFPSDIKSSALRGAIRAKVKLPVQVNGIDESGVINDISVTGAGIIADRALGELNEKALISFDFPIKLTNQSMHIFTSVIIRSIQQLPDKNKDAPPKFSHGVSFDELDLTSQMMLLNFVYESMNRLN